MVHAELRSEIPQPSESASGQRAAQNMIDVGVANYLASHGKGGLGEIDYGFGLLARREDGKDKNKQNEQIIDSHIGVADRILAVNPDQAKTYLMNAQGMMQFSPWPAKEEAWWQTAKRLGAERFTTSELESFDRPKAFYKALAGAKKSPQAEVDYRNIREVAIEKRDAIPK